MSGRNVWLCLLLAGCNVVSDLPDPSPQGAKDDAGVADAALHSTGATDREELSAEDFRRASATGDAGAVFVASCQPPFCRWLQENDQGCGTAALPTLNLRPPAKAVAVAGAEPDAGVIAGGGLAPGDGGQASVQETPVQADGGGANADLNAELPLADASGVEVGVATPEAPAVDAEASAPTVDAATSQDTALQALDEDAELTADANTNDERPFFVALERLSLDAEVGAGAGASAWIGVSGDRGQPGGFDLDGRCTQAPACAGVVERACRARGRALSVDGAFCTDNMFARLHGTLVGLQNDVPVLRALDEEFLNCGLRHGDFNQLIRISGYNGEQADDQVRLDFYPSPGLELPSVGWSCAEEAPESRGWIAASRWQLAAEALADGAPAEGEIQSSRMAITDAFVVDGYLIAFMDSGFSLSLPGGEPGAPGIALRLEQAWWIGRLVRNEDTTWSVTEGVLAGRQLTQDVLKALQSAGLCRDAAADVAYRQIAAYLDHFADLPGDALDQADVECDALSTAIRFEAAAAEPGEPVAGSALALALGDVALTEPGTGPPLAAGESSAAETGMAAPVDDVPDSEVSATATEDQSGCSLAGSEILELGPMEGEDAPAAVIDSADHDPQVRCEQEVEQSLGWLRSACSRCVCSSCPEALHDCASESTGQDKRLCTAPVECAYKTGCSGANCFWGPCRREIAAAALAENEDWAQVANRAGDPEYPLGRALPLGMCLEACGLACRASR